MPAERYKLAVNEDNVPYNIFREKGFLQKNELLSSHRLNEAVCFAAVWIGTREPAAEGRSDCLGERTGSDRFPFPFFPSSDGSSGKESDQEPLHSLMYHKDKEKSTVFRKKRRGRADVKKPKKFQQK